MPPPSGARSAEYPSGARVNYIQRIKTRTTGKQQTCKTGKKKNDAGANFLNFVSQNHQNSKLQSSLLEDAVLFASPK